MQEYEISAFVDGKSVAWGSFWNSISRQHSNAPFASHTLTESSCSGTFNQMKNRNRKITNSGGVNWSKLKDELCHSPWLSHGNALYLMESDGERRNITKKSDVIGFMYWIRNSRMLFCKMYVFIYCSKSGCWRESISSKNCSMPSFPITRASRHSCNTNPHKLLPTLACIQPA